MNQSKCLLPLIIMLEGYNLRFISIIWRGCYDETINLFLSSPLWSHSRARSSSTRTVKTMQKEASYPLIWPCRLNHCITSVMLGLYILTRPLYTFCIKVAGSQSCNCNCTRSPGKPNCQYTVTYHVDQRLTRSSHSMLILFSSHMIQQPFGFLIVSRR